jgi:hypothetical protein
LSRGAVTLRDGDASALTGEELGGAATNPGARSRDERDLAREPSHRRSIPDHAHALVAHYETFARSLAAVASDFCADVALPVDFPRPLGCV